MLHFLAEQRGAEPASAVELAILLDYYFMHVLALLTMRIWDDGDPDENLARVDALLAELQGPNGSGQQFAADAETLMLIGTSHYEPEEWGYGKLLAKVRTLERAPPVQDRPRPRRRAWAATCASASRRSAAATRWRCATTTSPTTRGCVLRWPR